MYVNLINYNIKKTYILKNQNRDKCICTNFYFIKIFIFIILLYYYIIKKNNNKNNNKNKSRIYFFEENYIFICLEKKKY